MRSPRQDAMDTIILESLMKHQVSDQVYQTAELLLVDEEIQAMQEYANTVSIKRLRYNDHGPVHMRTVVQNSIAMMELLKNAGIQTNLELEECGSFNDSLVAVLLASFLHDLGMTIGRHDHELHSTYLAHPIITRILALVYPKDIALQVTVRSLAIEGISGHMGNRPITSLEAGVVQVADGCDMTKGRARIPLFLAGGQPKPGGIHQYSASSIETVTIAAGETKPIHIEVFMSSEVGLFQVEEVLLPKISNSTAKSHVELFAAVKDEPLKKYF